LLQFKHAFFYPQPCQKGEKTDQKINFFMKQIKPTYKKVISARYKIYQNKIEEPREIQPSLNNMIDLIKYPVLNSKSFFLLKEYKKYMFDVDIRLSKPQIKNLLENYFNITILGINTHIPPRKMRRYTAIPGYQNRYKRVIIQLKKNPQTLKNDQTIPFFDKLLALFTKQMKQMKQTAPKQEKP
jgi:large subunit ribosomal protein L23